jgi:hypothetical protein
MAVLTLALGSGATTVFTVVSGVLLKPLPYPHSESFVTLRLSLDRLWTVQCVLPKQCMRQP